MDEKQRKTVVLEGLLSKYQNKNNNINFYFIYLLLNNCKSIIYNYKLLHFFEILKIIR